MRGSRSLCLVLVLASACPSHASVPAELTDAAARIQYAYYTRDTRQLRSALESLAQLSLPSDSEVLRNYQLGVGYWHLAELSRSAARRQALARCEEHLEAVLRTDARRADALAVHGLCAFNRGELRVGNVRRRECARTSAIAEAVEIAPRNPRVLYVQALCALKDGDTAKALELAQRAWNAFEEAPLDAEEHAGWGHAEACVLLARLQLSRGDRAQARDRAEQALILAPDYVAASELLAEIAGSR